MSQNEDLFWKKKEIVSFVLSILVFFIHIPSFTRYRSYTTGFIYTLNETTLFFIRESFTRFAVPMFFILSGVSFFRSYDNSKYLNKIKSRVFTLIIPYLIWNTIWTIFDVVCSHTFVSQFFVKREAFDLTFINILKGIFFYECNGPFWFVFNLIVFSFAAPLIHLVVRNKYIGIASISLLTVLATVGIGIPESIFFSSTSIIFYLIGAIIGEHYFVLASRKSTKTTQWISIVFLFSYITLKNIFANQSYPFKVLLQVIVFSAASFSLWNITDMFIHHIKPKKIYSRSFAIYAMHVNISGIIATLTYLCLPKNGWMAIPNFIITVALTLYSINLICNLLEKFLPKVYATLIGNRSQHSK